MRRHDGDYYDGDYYWEAENEQGAGFCRVAVASVLPGAIGGYTWDNFHYVASLGVAVALGILIGRLSAVAAALIDPDPEPPPMPRPPDLAARELRAQDLRRPLPESVFISMTLGNSRGGRCYHVDEHCVSLSRSSVARATRCCHCCGDEGSGLPVITSERAVNVDNH